jgi:hypothetical protein
VDTLDPPTAEALNRLVDDYRQVLSTLATAFARASSREAFSE